MNLGISDELIIIMIIKVCHLFFDNLLLDFITYIIISVYVEMKLMKIMCLNNRPMVYVTRSGCIYDIVFELHL